MALVMLLVLFLPNTYPEDCYTQLNLPEGAVARLGKGIVKGVLYSPDGTLLAVRTYMGIWLYDTTNYRTIALLTGDTGHYNSIAFSADGKTLASGSWTNTVRLWDTDTGEQKGTLTGQMLDVVALVFSRDGATLTGVDRNNHLMLWDTKTGEMKRIIIGDRIWIKEAAFMVNDRITDTFE